MTVFSVTEDVYGITLDDAETLSAYLIVDEEPTIVDPGTAAGVPQLLDALEAADLSPNDLRHVVIGHYHLDHAGAAPELLEAAPNATGYLHASMADWLTDPDRFEKLVSSTADSLGEQFEAMGAPDQPLSEDRLVRIEGDGRSLDIGSTSLEIVHTPGHSPDHLSVYDPERDLLFANEAIGRYFPRADVFHPPTTVPSFDIEATAASIDRLAEIDPEHVALSHYGVRDDPDALFETAQERLKTFQTRIPELYDESDEDLEETVSRVREELIRLDDDYPESVAAGQAEVCTHGVLRAVGRL
ncbi:MBL fold metallo-hydrolase [Halobacteria archaeon AArc-dxtr1]|nr:MBL fold metallo-hydrolase [Halobacteria archaeon AArc-dxtr1]